MNKEQKDAFFELEQSGYLPQLREHVMSRCAPFFWSSSAPGEPPALLHNGTICYVFTGDRHLGVTADHVYQQYLDDLAALPNVEAQFNGNTIRPEARLIARSKDLDLATFDVPAIFLSSSLGHVVHHAPEGWPPPKVEVGDVVIYGGFPGVLKELSPGKVGYPFESFTWKPTDVTPTNIVMHVDFPNLYWPGHEDSSINQDLGGISGGPVFRIIEELGGPAKRVYVELVGIVYEIHEGLEAVRARHIQHVQADGTLAAL